MSYTWAKHASKQDDGRSHHLRLEACVSYFCILSSTGTPCSLSTTHTPYNIRENSSCPLGLCCDIFNLQGYFFIYGDSQNCKPILKSEVVPCISLQCIAFQTCFTNTDQLGLVPVISLMQIWVGPQKQLRLSAQQGSTCPFTTKSLSAD